MAKKLTCPIGIAHYPHLNEPDTKFDAKGSYHTQLRMDSTDEKVEKFIKWMDAQYDASYEAAVEDLVDSGKCKTEALARKKLKRANKPYRYVEDEDTGEETDEILVTFKMTASGTSKAGKPWSRAPKIFMTKELAEQYPDALPAIWGGSKLSVSFTPFPWYTMQLGAGLKLRVEAFMLHELVTTGDGGDNAEDYGFGGAVAAPKAAAPKSREPGEDDVLGYEDEDDDGTGDF
jgi:hypothetical protein